MNPFFIVALAILAVLVVALIVRNSRLEFDASMVRLRHRLLRTRVPYYVEAYAECYADYVAAFVHTTHGVELPEQLYAQWSRGDTEHLYPHIQGKLACSIIAKSIREELAELSDEEEACRI